MMLDLAFLCFGIWQLSRIALSLDKKPSLIGAILLAACFGLVLWTAADLQQYLH